MSEWLARLRGDESALEVLSEYVSFSSATVKKEDNSYFLSSSDFASMSDDGARYEHAVELIKNINGVAFLCFGTGYSPVEVDSLFRRVNGSLQQVVGPILEVGWKVVDAVRPTTTKKIESLVALASRDSKFADCLYFFRQGDWSNLYKAWEILADAAGGLHEAENKRWVKQDDRRKFTQTAQSRKALGDDARHASERFSPPADPMSLEDARLFVHSAIMAWIEDEGL